jgi:hypothetical protein
MQSTDPRPRRQELRPLLEGMAGLIGCKVWYVTEKGELEVSSQYFKVFVVC